ncbi:ABC transporter ATP-binding protein [Nocardioides korecus]
MRVPNLTRVRALPLAHPGTPDHRSPARFLWWLARGQVRTLLPAMLLGSIWMTSQAVMPAVIGRAIDRGVAARDGRALLAYAGLMLLVGLVQATSGIARHRFAVTNWLVAAYRTVQLVARQSVRLGATLPRRASVGEVVAIGTTDLSHLGQVMDVSARFVGAIVSFVVVAVLLLRTSLTLGLVVLVGVPVLMLLVGPLLRPLQRRSDAQRGLMGELSTTAADIVGGLRVLRGIGGEDVFLARYRVRSQQARTAGVAVARLQSLLDALQVFLPGVFVVVVVWLGAREAVQGLITPGELVAFYGYSAFLMIPLRTVTEFANRLIRGLVSARRVCRVMALEPDHADPAEVAASPPEGSDLVDLRSGLHVAAGRFVALVCDRPDDAAGLADRLGLIAAQADDEVLLGGVPLSALPQEEVRRRVVVSDTGATLFSGRLRDRLDTRGAGDPARDTTGDPAHDTTGALTDALRTASAEDVLEGLRDGLDSVLAERGRTLSGGQRQRLVLVRALTLDPEVLVLVEPTSAVDAHTEARIAARLREHRAGRTTVVVTSSPLVLDSADEVALLVDGRVATTGTHAELLGDAAYRAVVTRETAEEVVGS